MTFDPKTHLQNIGKGGAPRWYLSTEARIVWFRSKYPDGAILTNPDIANGVVLATILIDDKPVASDLATIRDGKGTTWNGRDLEKAATAAIGRALKNAGFGTMQAMVAAELQGMSDDGDEELDYLADAPQEPPATPKGTPPRRANPHDAAMAERPTDKQEITVEVGSFTCHQKKDGSGVFYVLTATPGEMDYDRVGDRKIYAFSRHAFAGTFYSNEEMAGWDEIGASVQLPGPIPVQIKLDQHDTGTQFWKVAGE